MSLLKEFPGAPGAANALKGSLGVDIGTPGLAQHNGSSWDYFAKNVAGGILLSSLALGPPLPGLPAVPGQALIMNPGGTSWAPSVGGHNDFIDRNVLTTGTISSGSTTSAILLAATSAGVAGIWGGANVAGKSDSNYALAFNAAGGISTINASDHVNLAVANVVGARVDNTGLTVNASSLSQVVGRIQPLVSSAFSAVYLGNITPSATNFVIAGDGDPTHNSAINGGIGVTLCAAGVTRLFVGVGLARFANIEAYTITQLAPITDVVAPFDLTLRSMAPLSGATIHQSPGNLVYDIAAPVGTGTRGNHIFKVSGNRAGQIGTLVGPFASVNQALWVGDAVADDTNWIISKASGVKGVSFNAPSAGTGSNAIGFFVGLTQHTAMLAGGGLQLFAYTTPGILHNNGSGVVSSSLIVDADVTSIGWSKLTGIPDVSNTVHGIVTAITGTGKVLLSGSGTAAVWGAITDTYISDVAPGKLSSAGAVAGQAMLYSGSVWGPTAGGHNDFIDRNLTTTGTVTASTAFAAPTKLSFKVGSTVRMEIDSVGVVKLNAYLTPGLIYGDGTGALSTINNTIAGKVLMTVGGTSPPDWSTPTVDWLNITSKPGDVSNTAHGFVTTITGTGKVLLSGTGTAAIWGAVTDTYISDLAWSKVTGRPSLTGAGAIQIDGVNTAVDLSVSRTISVLSATGSVLGVVKLANDLGGTALLPAVVNISGNGVVAQVRCSEFLWDAGLFPTWAQSISVSGSGRVSSIIGQAGQASGNTNGGDVSIQGGLQHGTGLLGGVQLGIGNGNVLFEVTEVAPGKYVLALGHITAVSTAATGADPGSLTTFVSDCAQEPTTDPSSGTMFYSKGGSAKFRRADGIRVHC